jgi:UDP-hydrolysing UDP-N-acetyl-D-glucosamine 2-epimerase
VTGRRPVALMAVTGSRADWGLLASPLALLRDDPAFRVSLAVTGQHLTPEGEASLSEIAGNGFAVDARIDLHQPDTTSTGVAQALAAAVAGFSNLLNRRRPDMLIVAGDRFEIFGAVQAALLARTPVAHLCGGDVTEGSVDDAVRHAITKMSHLHFVTNADAASRVRQMGEDPEHIHRVGSPGLDRLRSVSAMPRAAFFDSIRLQPREKNAVVTFHPATLSGDSELQCAELLAALDASASEIGLIFTGVNLDVSGNALQRMIDAFAARRANAVVVASLGSQGYISALTHADLVIGNSSSGLYEAPSFGIPTVNIGDRQKGRLRATSVIDCEPERASILAAIELALARDSTGTVNPYGDGHSSERIVAILKEIGNPAALLKKKFQLLETPT